MKNINASPETLKMLVANFKQVDKYCLKFTGTKNWATQWGKSLRTVAENTGGTFRKIAPNIYKVSDPLCQMLEASGMNE